MSSYQYSANNNVSKSLDVIIECWKCKLRKNSSLREKKENITRMTKQPLQMETLRPPRMVRMNSPLTAAIRDESSDHDEASGLGFHHTLVSWIKIDTFEKFRKNLTPEMNPEWIHYVIEICLLAMHDFRHTSTELDWLAHD